MGKIQYFDVQAVPVATVAKCPLCENGTLDATGLDCEVVPGMKKRSTFQHQCNHGKCKNIEYLTKKYPLINFKNDFKSGYPKFLKLKKRKQTQKNEK